MNVANGHFVITISRLCGAGGTSIGNLLSEKLGIPVYGRELLRMASDMSGINEELFERADERIRNGLLFKISKEVYDGRSPSPAPDFTADHDLFDYQAKVLRKLAESESYIVIGRCADYILRDFPNVVRVFVTSDEAHCVEHLMKRSGLTREKKRGRKSSALTTSAPATTATTPTRPGAVRRITTSVSIPRVFPMRTARTSSLTICTASVNKPTETCRRAHARRLFRRKFSQKAKYPLLLSGSHAIMIL